MWPTIYGERNRCKLLSQGWRVGPLKPDVGLSAAVRITLSLPGPLLTLHHHSSQDPVYSRLVTRAFGLEPLQHFGIHAQRNPPFARTVPARLRVHLPIRQ